MLVNNLKIKDLAKIIGVLIKAGRSTEKALQDITQAYMLTEEEADKLGQKVKEAKYD